MIRTIGREEWIAGPYFQPTCPTLTPSANATIDWYSSRVSGSQQAPINPVPPAADSAGRSELI